MLYAGIVFIAGQLLSGLPAGRFNDSGAVHMLVGVISFVVAGIRRKGAKPKAPSSENGRSADEDISCALQEVMEVVFGEGV